MRDPCKRDTDCVLGTDYSCCGNCLRVDPYWAVSRAHDERDRKSQARLCARGGIDCGGYSCSKAPSGCIATPICANGRCKARLSSACGPE